MGPNDILLERHKYRQGRQSPLATFDKKITRAGDLVDFAEKIKGKGSQGVKSEAHRQYIISLVTALEVYLSDLSVELIDSERLPLKKNFFEQFPQKYDIQEVNTFLKNGITMGELICSQNNFQNQEQTFAFLTNLFGVNAANLLKENKFSYETVSGQPLTVFLRRDFPRKLGKVIHLRHVFVHDITFTDTPSWSDMLSYRKLVQYLVLCVDAKADEFRGIKTSAIVPK